MARRMWAAPAVVAIVAGCATAPVEAPPPPEPRFSARGQEPGWLAVVEPGKTISLSLDYGERNAVTGPASLAREPGRMIWTVTSQLGPVRLEAAERTCVDVMNGEAYPALVTLTVADRTYVGCGAPG